MPDAPSVREDRGTSPAAPDTVTDGSLVRRLRVGDEAAALNLYRRYATRLRALARAKASTAVAARVDADEVVQSVFRRFLTAAKAGRYDVPAGDDLWDLLLAITLNKVRAEERFHRAECRDVRRTAALPPDGIPGPIPAARGTRDEVVSRLAVQDILAHLPEDHRRAVEYRLNA